MVSKMTLMGSCSISCTSKDLDVSSHGQGKCMSGIIPPGWLRNLLCLHKVSTHLIVLIRQVTSALIFQRSLSYQASWSSCNEHKDQRCHATSSKGLLAHLFPLISCFHSFSISHTGSWLIEYLWPPFHLNNASASIQCQDLGLYCPNWSCQCTHGCISPSNLLHQCDFPCNSSTYMNTLTRNCPWHNQSKQCEH